MKDRVCFYSKYDLSSPYYLEKAEPIISEFDENNSYSNINDVIELYHIGQFIKNGLWLNTWPEAFIKKTELFNTVICKYFDNINSGNIVEIYNTVDFYYKKSFWKIINDFNIKNLITDDNLRAIVSSNIHSLHDILTCKNIVKQNNKIITTLLLEYPISAEWLLNHYVSRCDGSDRDALNIPDSMTVVDKEIIINKYLDDKKNANLNYVGLVINAKDEKTKLIISPKTRLKAKKLEEEKLKEISQHCVPASFKYSVVISREENIEPTSCYDDDGIKTFKYNANVIDKLDESGIMHYFIYGFEYLSVTYLINLISMPCHEDVTERTFGLHSRNAYRNNFEFRKKNVLSVLKMKAMSETLNYTNRRIETIIKSFYEDYLSERYSYPAKKIVIPSVDNNYVEKIRILAPELDSIVKHFNLYAKEGTVDTDLLAVESNIKVTDSISCVKKKYFTMNDKNVELNLVIDLLFGDQSMLSYVDPYKDKHYHSLFSLLQTSEQIDCKNYSQYQLDRLNILIEKGFFSIDANNILQVIDWPSIMILNCLNQYKSVPYWHLNQEMRYAIQNMEKKGWVKEVNTLLTPEESNYFSFILNNEKYTNAYAIRNNYVHGNNSNSNEGENDEIAYIRLLIIFVLLLLKIEEDLALKKFLGNDGHATEE